MKKHLPFILKSMVFLTLTLLLVIGLTKIFTPKYTLQSIWATSTTIEAFYELPEDSIDVLFLGSSHAASSFSPQELYSTYGISSYNLATEQQNVLLSYYLLEEALRSQSPSVVVLDTMFLFPYTSSPLNSDENCTRKVVDSMEFSSVKQSLIADICTFDESQSALSYYFPLLNYHTRWESLTASDFLPATGTADTSLHGFTALTGTSNNTTYEPIILDDSVAAREPVALMQVYLDKITALCAQQGIELVLAKTLTTSWTVSMHNTLQNYADENALLLIDFNESTVFSQMDFNYATDQADGGHANLTGATKITNTLGQFLLDYTPVSPRESSSLEESARYYQQLKNNYLLSSTTDLATYLSLLDPTTQTIFITAKYEAIAGLPAEISEQLASLGFSLTSIYDLNANYSAMLSEGVLTEQLSFESIEYAGTLSNGQTYYCIASAGSDYGDSVSIKINNKEYTNNQYHLNLVVYDNATATVLDDVSIDMYREDYSLIH